MDMRVPQTGTGSWCAYLEVKQIQPQIENTSKWATYFNRLASADTNHAKVGLSRWGSRAVYGVAEWYLGGKILDLGCGSGGLPKYLPRCKVVGVDISLGQLKNAWKWCLPCLASAAHLPFKDNAFDSSAALAVLQNCDVPLKSFISELHRVSNGNFFLSALSHRYEKDTSLKLHDPNEVLAEVSRQVGQGRIEYGAIRFEREKFWVDDWNAEGAGLFFIYAEP